jgi:hypothetical protein
MELVLNDLIETCAVLREHAVRGQIAYGINYAFTWPNGKRKTLDLAIGIPLVKRDPPEDGRIHRLRSRGGKRQPLPSAGERFSRLLISCEAKSVMTEHGKSQPRVFDELNGSHAIVHAGSRDTIAAGMTLINIALSFISATRQKRGLPVVFSPHIQPQVTEDMVAHLRGLPIRDDVEAVGFDAYCSFVMDVDNQGGVALWDAPPAPQPGDRDHYEEFLARICRFYVERFREVDDLPDPMGLSEEEALSALARQYPGLLTAAGQLAVDHRYPGAAELLSILRAIELQASTESST